MDGSCPNRIGEIGWIEVGWIPRQTGGMRCEMQERYRHIGTPPRIGTLTSFGKSDCNGSFRLTSPRATISARSVVGHGMSNPVPTQTIAGESRIMLAYSLACDFMNRPMLPLPRL